MSVVSNFVNKANFYAQMKEELNKELPVFIYTDIFGGEHCYAKIDYKGNLCFMSPHMNCENDIRAIRELVNWLKEIYLEDEK